MKRELINSTGSFSKKDLLNSRNGIALQDVSGEKFKVVKAAQLHVTEDDGEEKNVSVIVTEDEEIYTAISSSVYDTTSELIDIITDEGPTDVKIKARKSKSGRDFLTMLVL